MPKIMEWKDSGETQTLKKPRDLKPLADQMHQVPNCKQERQKQ